MDAEGGELFLGGGVAAGGWRLDDPSCSDLAYGGSGRPLLDWAVDPDCVSHPHVYVGAGSDASMSSDDLASTQAAVNPDSESEDVLLGVDPNEVFRGGPAADPSSESDSGISEDPVVGSAVAMVTGPSGRPTPVAVYQVVYDIGGLGGVKAGPGQEDVISIELDEWRPQVVFSDSCIVNELPVVAVAHLGGGLALVDPPSSDDGLLFPELQLTEEEQKLLDQEGVSLPDSLPLTKAEERILKKVRRKIRNKQSAMDSRRRKKEYIDGLEGRAAACAAQNQELQRTVEQLEKRNISLLSQLRQLQSLIKQTVGKGAQTSTCLLIILVSLGLIILPSFSPFRRDAAVDDDYRPIGVISRNILTDPASSPGSSSPPSPPAAAEGIESQSDILSPPSGLDQSGRPEGAALVPQEPTENPDGDVDGTAQEGEQKWNSPLLVAEPPAAGGKPAHADEM